MTIKKEFYIKQIAVQLEKNRKRIDSLSSKDSSQMTQRAIQKMNVDLNWECLHRSMNEERLRFALGDLKPEDCREHYEPSSFHKYRGVRAELEKLILI